MSCSAPQSREVPSSLNGRSPAARTSTSSTCRGTRPDPRARAARACGHRARRTAGPRGTRRQERRAPELPAAPDRTRGSCAAYEANMSDTADFVPPATFEDALTALEDRVAPWIRESCPSNRPCSCSRRAWSTAGLSGDARCHRTARGGAHRGACVSSGSARLIVPGSVPARRHPSPLSFAIPCKVYARSVVSQPVQTLPERQNLSRRGTLRGRVRSLPDPP